MEDGEELDTKEMLAAILAKQTDISGDIKSLITTVSGVQKDLKTLKQLVAKVNHLTNKCMEMERRVTAVENNTNKNEILDEVKALLSKKKNDVMDAGRSREILQMIKENKNVVISNLGEAAAIASDSSVQLRLSKISTLDKERRPFAHT